MLVVCMELVIPHDSGDKSESASEIQGETHECMHARARKEPVKVVLATISSISMVLNLYAESAI